VATERVKFVSTLRTSTVTPGRAAPLESATIPSIAPVVICDCAAGRTGIINARATANRREDVRIGMAP